MDDRARRDATPRAIQNRGGMAKNAALILVSITLEPRELRRHTQQVPDLMDLTGVQRCARQW